jgi:hypothetical protein
MDENIEVKQTDGVLTMKGERQEEKEGKKKRKRREKEGLLPPGAQLNAASNCRRALTPTRSKRASRKAYLP